MPKLKRAINLPLLTLYGLGNILGAGIYVLIGEVAGLAGYASPLSFLIAFAVASLTAFSYMELSSRYPKTAGVPVYLHKAFNLPSLSTLVGLMLVGAGVVSAATLARGFVGYFSAFIDAPAWLIIVGAVVLLSAFALIGISHSARLAAVFTLIEVAGLSIVIVTATPYLSELPELFRKIGETSLLAPGVLLAAFVAFYAFIGFEDMIDVAEEVKNPTKTMPRAILLALIVSTVVYGLVVIAALLVLNPSQLASSDAPLAAVYSAATGNSPSLLAAIGAAAITNGILVQIIMGSRILYGLASRGWIHSSLARVHQTARTPVASTLIVTVIIIVLALSLPLIRLAELTSLLILMVFALVNISLLVLKGRGRANSRHHQVPMWVPALGTVGVLGMLLASLYLKN